MISRLSASVFYLFIVLFLTPAVPFSQTEPVVLGADDDEGMLLMPTQAEAGPDGNIYVLDAGDSWLKTYTPSGEFLRKLGGPGEGPGEFQRVDGATFGFRPDGNLFFTEFLGGHRWLTILQPNGDLIGEVAPEPSVTFGVEGASALPDGSFLAHLTYGFKPRAVGDYYLYEDVQALVHLAADGQILAEIDTARFGRSISLSNDGGSYNLPFAPVFAWTALADGSVVCADGLSRKFRVHDLEGHLVREIETGLPAPEKVTNQDLDHWRQKTKARLLSRNRTWYERFGRVIELYHESLYDSTNLVGLTTTAGGNILVAGRLVAGTGRQHYWLLDRDGKTLAHVLCRASNLRISAGFVLYLASDSEGNPLVYCRRRTGTEAEDLLAVEGAVSGD